MWELFNELVPLYYVSSVINGRIIIPPLLPSEIRAYCELVHVRIAPDDVRLMLRIDAPFRAALAKPRKQRLDIAVDNIEGVKAMFANMPGGAVLKKKKKPNG